MLNNLAWGLYEHGRRDLLSKAEVWASEAVGLEPENGNYKHMLASVFVRAGKVDEALEVARSYVEDRETVEGRIDDAIDLFVGITAAGYRKEAFEVLRGSASAETLAPLVVGLRMYVREEVKAAAEIMEVGKDVVKRIEERRKKIQAERGGEGKAEKK